MSRVSIVASSLGITATIFAAEQRVIHSQSSWVIASPQVELAVTKLGAHMAPVTFFRDTAKPVPPYHISPWQDEGLKDLPLQFKDASDADFTPLPARRGYGDLLQLCNEPGEIAWTAAVRTDEVWMRFALTIVLRTDRPTNVNYIQGAARVPAGFDVVKAAIFKPGEVTFVAASGQRTTIAVRHEFLKSGQLR